MSNNLAKAKKALEEFRAAHPEFVIAPRPEMETAIPIAPALPGCPSKDAAACEIELEPASTPDVPAQVRASAMPKPLANGGDLELDDID